MQKTMYANQVDDFFDKQLEFQSLGTSIMITQKQYIQLLLITFGLLSLFLLLALLLKSAVEILFLIFAGILFAIFIRGLSRFLFMRFINLPENLAIVLTLLLLVTAFIFFIILLAPQLADQAGKIVEQLPAALENIREKTGSLGWLQELLQKESSASLTAAGEMSKRFLGIFATTFGILSSLFIILIIGLYLCFTPWYYVDGFLRLVPVTWRSRGSQVFLALNYILGRWLIGRFVCMLLVTLLTFFGLLFLGVTLPLGLAVLAGLFTFIPYLGPIISAVPAILLGFMQSSTTALYVILLYLIIQTIESYLITPLIQQKEVSLPPVLTLASQVVLGSIFGFPGMLLASPLTASALVLVKMLYIEQVFHEPTEVNGTDT